MASSGRHLARRSAVQALYQWDMTGQNADAILANFIMDKRLKGRYLDYFKKLIEEIPTHSEQIDALIKTYADRPISLLDPLERSVLRVATYEILHQIDVPHKVILNEAIEIAKLFCADKGYKFVNAVLDKIVKAQATPSQTTT